MFGLSTAQTALLLTLLGLCGAGLKLFWPTISSLWIDKRELRVTVHKASFGANGTPHFFVNITNLSRNRELEITHVWFDLNPQIPVMPPQRRLPKRLRPDEAW